MPSPNELVSEKNAQALRQWVVGEGSYAQFEEGGMVYRAARMASIDITFIMHKTITTRDLSDAPATVMYYRDAYQAALELSADAYANISSALDRMAISDEEKRVEMRRITSDASDRC